MPRHRVRFALRFLAGTVGLGIVGSTLGGAFPPPTRDGDHSEPAEKPGRGFDLPKSDLDPSPAPKDMPGLERPDAVNRSELIPAAAAGPCDISCDGAAVPEGESDCGAASDGGDGTDLVNGGCSFSPNRFSSLSCGGTYCGTVGAEGGFRDEDWYLFTLTAETGVVATLRAEFSGEFRLLPIGIGPAACNFLDAIALVHIVPCMDTVLSTCLPAGRYALVVVPDVFSGLGCGAEYNLHLACDTADPASFCRGACVNTTSCLCDEATLQTDCAAADEAFYVATTCCDLGCVPPGQTYASLNMPLLSRVPLDQFPSNSSSANDVWGFTSPRGRKYAVIGLTEGTGFVDITYPRSPEVVAEIPDTSLNQSDMRVYWPYAYNVQEGASGGGMQIMDLSQIDPPTRTVTLAGVFTELGLQSSHTLAMDLDSGFLYLNGSNLNSGALVAVDLGDPANPQIAGQALDPIRVHDSQVVTYGSGPYSGRQIAFCCDGGAGLRILDVTDKSNMFELSALGYPTLGFTHQGWLTEDRRYFVVNDESDEFLFQVVNTTTYIVDVQDLLAPFLAAVYAHPTGCWIDHDLMTRGDRVYQAQYTAGMRVLDISDPLAPVETAYFDSYPEDNSPNFSGMWGSYSDYPTRLVVGSDMERGLFVLCDEPEKPLASFTIGGNPGPVGLSITFDAASSTHCTPTRSVVGYEWDFDYDGTTLDVEGTGLVVNHAYPQVGSYVIALRVTDDDAPPHTEISALPLRVVADCQPSSPVFGPEGGATRMLTMAIGPPNCTIAMPGGGEAIQITMLDLQNPIPPNAPQYPPPDFSTYEAGTCTAVGESGGCARWVGPPITALESQDSPGAGNFRGARLQCTAYYHDWASENLIHVTGGEIAPSSSYGVKVYGSSCKGSEPGCGAVSQSVTMATHRAGDVASPYNPPSPTQQPDGLDVSQIVAKFKNLPGAPKKANVQVQPNLPGLNSDIDAIDIVIVVDNFKGFAYSFSGPCVCPSTVTCNVTPCANPTPCGNGTCVKTCAGGTNDTLPCINNSHCPGGSCGAGFCRDRCGRCTP